MATIRIPDRDRTQLYRGEHDDLRAAVAHCAARGIRLDGADLRGAVLDGADLSGLQAPHSDLASASLIGCIANRLVNGLQLDLSAAFLQDAVIEDCDFTEANFACTAPTNWLRVKTGTGTRLRGCGWKACEHVIEIARDDRCGKAIAHHDGVEWWIHAGERGVFREVDAKTSLRSLGDATQRERYVAAFAEMDSIAGVTRKRAIEERVAQAPIRDQIKSGLARGR